jgi:hypothetical protein
MKPLRIELRIRLEELMVELISANSMNAIYDLQDKAKQLRKDIENWYIKCQDEGITSEGIG